MECNGSTSTYALNFVGFSQVTIVCLGNLIVKINVQDEPMYTIVYVANVGESIEHMILGRQWIHYINCQLDWETRHYALKVNTQKLTELSEEHQQLHLYQQVDKTKTTKVTLEEETLVKLTIISRKCHTQWVILERLLTTQGYSKGQTTLWVSKSARVLPTSTNVMPKNKRTTQRRRHQQH